MQVPKYFTLLAHQPPEVVEKERRGGSGPVSKGPLDQFLSVLSAVQYTGQQWHLDPLTNTPLETPAAVQCGRAGIGNMNEQW